MKRINWIFMTAICLLSVMALSFSGCSDDDEVSMSSSDLVGTWQLVRYHYQWKENGKVVEEGDEEDDSTRLRFEEDKKELKDKFIETAKTKFCKKYGHEPKVYPVVISDGAHKVTDDEA